MKRRRDKRAITLVATVAAAALLALALQSIPTGTSPEPQDANGTQRGTNTTATNPHTALLDRHFAQGVNLLQAGQHQQAAGHFHAVLQLAPVLPEAHVNLGFALLELGQAAPARDAFKAALDLRPMQANAYWGLAVSLEKLCDIPGARGAMRTYVHLADAESPYLRRAQAALWEWENNRSCQNTDYQHRD